jgi:hypothetical protein
MQAFWAENLAQILFHIFLKLPLKFPAELDVETISSVAQGACLHSRGNQRLRRGIRTPFARFPHGIAPAGQRIKNTERKQ